MKLHCVNDRCSWKLKRYINSMRSLRIKKKNSDGEVQRVINEQYGHGSILKNEDNLQAPGVIAFLYCGSMKITMGNNRKETSNNKTKHDGDRGLLEPLNLRMQDLKLLLCTDTMHPYEGLLSMKA